MILRPSAAAAMPDPLGGGRRGRAEGRGVEGGPAGGAAGEDGEVAVGGELLGGLDQVREIHLKPLLSLAHSRTLHLISTASPKLFHVFGFRALVNFFAALHILSIKSEILEFN